jgi:hypothetical protein
MEDDCSNGVNGSGNSLPMTSLRTISSSNSISAHTSQSHGYVPIAAKGHKESVYALAMNDNGSLLVSGGTEKVYSDIYGNCYTSVMFLHYLCAFNDISFTYRKSFYITYEII